MATQNYNSPFTGDVLTSADTTYNTFFLNAPGTFVWAEQGAVEPLTANTYIAANINDISLLNGAQTIKLPDATLATLGVDLLIRNLSAFSLTVTSNTNTNAVGVAPGAAVWFYLTDNSTPAGIWRNVTLGAGTSAADAAALVGGGLAVSLDAKIALAYQVNQSASAPTLNENSRGNVYVWTGGSGTYALPVPQQDAWNIMVRNNGTGQLTLMPPAGYEIDNVQSVQLLPGESTIIVYQALNQDFFTIGRNRLSNFYFSSSVWDTSNTGGTLDLTQYATIIQRYRSSSSGQPVTIDLPPSTNTYYIINSTTFPLTFQIPGTPQGNTVTIAALQQSSIVADGTNLYAINTIQYGSLTLTDSSRAQPALTISAQQTGFYAQANTAGISVNGGQTYVEVQQNQIVLGGNVVGAFDGGYVV